ncbi:Replication factor A protein [Arachis hypogaea]|nr:Replication factor A protein [Arachis hypogaea]
MVDQIKSLVASGEHKVWKLIVRVIRLLTVFHFANSGLKAPIEMVVLDKEGDTIQCSIKGIFVPIFESLLAEGNVYVVTNFTVALNTIKFKPTRHEFRIHFKRDTIVRPVQDSSVPLNGFNFVPLKKIHAESKEDGYLVDMISQLASKGNLVEFTQDGKPSSYITIELDDLEYPHPPVTKDQQCSQSHKSDTTTPATTHQPDTSSPTSTEDLVRDRPTVSGVIGVSNPNYNLKLFINVEFSAARDFFTRVNKFDPVDGQGIMLLVCDQPISVEEDFSHLSIYKTIAEIKKHNQDAIFVTAWTIKEVETEFGWWYKGCKKCCRGFRKLEKRYFCPKCIDEYGFYVPRYKIHVRVIDHTDAASFVWFDGEAVNFLGISASDLRQSCVIKRSISLGILSFQLKMRNLNSYEPYVIHVLRMTNENSLVSAFLNKYNPDPGLLSHENSNLLSLSTGSYDPSKACESESTPSPTIDEKHGSKILGAKKHMEEARDELVSSKSKKRKSVVMED